MSARRPAPAVSAAAALAAAAVALFLGALPLRAEVRRLDPRTTYLHTRMGARKAVYLYMSPAAPAPPAPSPPGAASASSGRSAVILISGEAGWRPLQQDTASFLAAEGRTVLGIDAGLYFGQRLREDEWARDLVTIRSYLNEQAGRAVDSPVVLAGFYYGANMVPYILNRAGAAGVLGALLIAPTREGAEIYRVGIPLKLPTPPGEAFDVGQEIRHMPALPTVLIQGTLDEEGASKDFLPLLNGPRKYMPIVGADRLFRDTRDLYMTRVSEALTWMEDLQPIPPAPQPAPVLHAPGGPPHPPPHD